MNKKKDRIISALLEKQRAIGYSILDILSALSFFKMFQNKEPFLHPACPDDEVHYVRSWSR